MKKQRKSSMTLNDGTVIREGDKVRAIGEGGRGLRICEVLWVERGGKNGTAVLTSKRPGFGTVVRKSSEIKPLVKV